MTLVRDGRLSLSVAQGHEEFQIKYFFRVMPIQREWYYIDRQADREAVDQMLPSVL